MGMCVVSTVLMRVVIVVPVLFMVIVLVVVQGYRLPKHFSCLDCSRPPLFIGRP